MLTDRVLSEERIERDNKTLKLLESYGIDTEFINNEVYYFLELNNITYSDYHNGLLLKDDVCRKVHKSYGPVHVDESDNCFRYVWGKDSKYHYEDLEWSSHADEYFLSDDIIIGYGGIRVTQEYVASFNTGYYYLNECNDSDSFGLWMYYSDCVYCQDIQCRVPEEEANYCRTDDEYYFDENEMPEDITKSRSKINQYHAGPKSLDKTEGSEIAIGFEVEKNTIKGLDEDDVGEEIGEYDMFARYETDSSCGLEAITHIFPLSPVRSTRRKKFFEIMDAAEEILNEPTNIKCGGHVTISAGKNGNSAIHNPMPAIDLLEKIKGNLSIIYALYRYRLNNSFCSGNKSLKNLEHEGGHLVVEVKNRFNAIEIRLFNRVRNIKQLKLRYDLTYLIVNAGLRNIDFSVLLKQVKPILMKMYDNDREKVNNILELSVYFRTYLIADVVHEKIDQFINGPDND